MEPKESPLSATDYYYYYTTTKTHMLLRIMPHEEETIVGVEANDV